MGVRFRRPRNTTANPKWHEAESAVDLVPEFDDATGSQARLARLCGHFVLTQGQYAGRPLSEVWLPWQEAAFRAIERSRETFLLVSKGPLALDTPIATLDGWRDMGDLKIGDFVFSGEGKPTMVVGVSEVFTGRRCYRITFSDGEQIVCDESHGWPLMRRRGRGDRASHTRIDTAEIAANYRMPPSSSKNPQARWNYTQDVAPALDCPDADLPIDPYFLGVWLGNGTTAVPQITSGLHDAEFMHEAIGSSVDGARVSMSEKPWRGCATFYISRETSSGSKFLSLMRGLGLLGNKHIPAIYKRASIRQRMALLQGLMDTDGYVCAKGSLELTLCCKRLALDAEELIRSLGLKVRAVESAAMLNGREVGRRWRMTFQAYRDNPVFRLPRKFERLRRRSETRPLSMTRSIVSVEEVESVPTRCITVADKSHIFLAGKSLVPTFNSGKSLIVSALAIAFVMRSAADKTNTRGMVAIMASSIDTARIVWSHIYEAVLIDEDLRKKFKSNIASRTLTHMSTGIDIQVLSPTMDSAVGRRPVLLIFDESHEFSRIRDSVAIANQLRQGSRNWGDAARIVTISTMPVGEPVGEFRRLLRYARSVRDGEIKDDDFLPLLYEFPVQKRPDLDPLDESQWWRGMPSLRTPDQPGTLDVSEMRLEFDAAIRGEDPESLSLLLSQRLGIERNVRNEDAQTVLHSHWDACPVSKPVAGARVVGIDIGGMDDPAALAVAVREESGVVSLFVRQYLTKRGYDRAVPSTREVYDAAIKRGTLAIHESMESLEQAIFSACTEIASKADDVVEFGGDEHGGAAGFKGRFEAAVGTWTTVPQRDHVMSSALAELEALLLDGRLRRPDCPLVSFNVRALSVEHSDTGARKLRKRDAGLSDSGPMKIDGIIASVMAVKLMSSRSAFSVMAAFGGG